MSEITNFLDSFDNSGSDSSNSESPTIRGGSNTSFDIR